MRPEYYADLYRRYQTYCRNYNGNRLFKIASGSGEYDLHWTETMMKQARNQMNGLSLHYYTVAGWSGRALQQISQSRTIIGQWVNVSTSRTVSANIQR